jgi:hypothetical protein
MKLSPKEIQTAYYCLATVIRSRRQDVPRPVSDLFNRLDAEFHRPLSPARHGMNGEADDSGELKLLGAAEAAELLRISERTAQRNHKKLGGQMVSGICVFDRGAILRRMNG